MARSKLHAAPRALPESASDALVILHTQHAAITERFARYAAMSEGHAAADEQKGELAAEICVALAVHARLEEEIFYPAVQDDVDDALLLAATVEHNSAKELIAQLEMMAAGDEYFDSTVWVLGEYVQHHFRDEEERMFPAIRAGAVNTAAIGRRLAEHKAVLEAEMRESVPATQPGSLSPSGLLEAEEAAARDDDYEDSPQ